MSNNQNYFIGRMNPPKSSMVIGLNGPLPIMGLGTVKWNITDDDGRQHVSKIPGSLYVPRVKTSILSPQHWASHMVQDSGQTAWEEKRPNKLIIHWNGGRNKRTVPLHPNTNTPILTSSIGAKNYRVFESVFNKLHQPRCVACTRGVVNSKISDQIHEQNMLDIISNHTLTRLS